MPIHILKLIEQHEVAQGTVLLKFIKPAGFSFKPGQYGGFTLINPAETDANGITRRFSLLSTPADDYIAIATRVQNSAFKRVLTSLPVGAEIKFAGPTGNFILHDDATVPAVMLAGGIGIAPFYSMIRDAAHRHTTQPLFLFYGNQSPPTAAFLAELKEIQKSHPAFQLIATIDKPAPNWEGNTGFISENLIKKYIKDLAAPIYYVCGSPVMVTALQEMLAEMGVDENRIRVEDFPGY